MRLVALTFLVSLLWHRYITFTPTANAGIDICHCSEKAAKAATLLAQTQNYDSAVASIKKAQLSSYKEYVIAFGKDSAGSIIHSSISAGNINNGHIPYISNRLADIHIHTNEQPPSSGDLYGFIDQITANSNYIRYIITPGGKAYALVLMNKKEALTFNISYARRAGIRQVQTDGSSISYQPTFPPQLVDELNQLRSWNHATPETALTFLLKKYNTGIALLKRNANGIYSALDVVEKTDNGKNKVYQLIQCL